VITDELFVKIFFMTYRAFASRSQVFQGIAARYRGPPLPPQALEEFEPPLSRIRYGVCKVLVHWFIAHLSDFDERGRQEMTAFTEEGMLLALVVVDEEILINQPTNQPTNNPNYALFICVMICVWL
jgi:hypothetical protein